MRKDISKQSIGG